MAFGGVPERSNGAVLKTAGGRKVARGFKSHPRRSVKPKPQSETGFGVFEATLARHSVYPLRLIETHGDWHPLARNWRALGLVGGYRAWLLRVNSEYAVPRTASGLTQRATEFRRQPYVRPLVEEPQTRRRPHRWLCLYLEEHERATLEDVALLVSNLRSLATRTDHARALAILRKAARPG